MSGRRSVFGGRESGPAGDIFVAIAYLGAGIAAILVLVAAVERDRMADDGVAPLAIDDTTPRIRSTLAERSELAIAWSEALQEICENTDLQAEGLAPNCETGAITIGDRLFEPSAPQLSEEGMRKVQLALPIMLSALRSRDVVWNHLASIEVRGHTDPRARRDPYTTNLVGSQQRPLGVMLYLASEWALS